MLSLTCGKTGPILSGLERFRVLKRSRGSLRASYSVLCKGMQLPLLRRCADLCVSEIYHLSLAGGKKDLPALRSLVVRAAGAGDLDALVQFYGDRPLLESRFDRGDLCILALCKEQVVAAAWFAVGPSEFHEDQETMHYYSKIPSGAAWIYDGRGTKLGAWGTLMAKLPQTLASRNIDNLVALVNFNNWRAIDAHRSLGFKSTATIGYVGAFGLHRCFFRTKESRWRPLPATVSGVELCV
jgi:hypothetical protein